MDDNMFVGDSTACSRRSFLKGVGATAGFTLLAGAGLGATGCAPQEDGANLAETGHTVVTPRGTYEVYETDMLVCGCGYAGMSAAANAANLGLTGMEFAHGIPGTVGGGVYMNAGAYGGEICQICESVEVMDLDGNLSRLSNAEMAFSYRHSALENRTGIVVSADFALKKGNPEEIWAKMKDLIAGNYLNPPPVPLPSRWTFLRPVLHSNARRAVMRRR